MARNANKKFTECYAVTAGDVKKNNNNKNELKAQTKHCSAKHENQVNISNDWFFFFFFFFIELRFYGPVNLLGSSWAGQFTYPHFFLGRLSPLSSLLVSLHILSSETDNCPSWISRREWLLKIFDDQSTWKNVAGPGRDWTHDLLITSQTHIQLRVMSDGSGQGES